MVVTDAGELEGAAGIGGDPPDGLSEHRGGDDFHGDASDAHPTQTVGRLLSRRSRLQTVPMFRVVDVKLIHRAHQHDLFAEARVNA
jgi:hypothetical protein